MTASLAGVIVCGPDPANYRKRYWRCPTCQCVTETVALYEYWHGVSTFCCRCGDAWYDGDLNQRPFARGWRQKRIARHLALWERATHGPGPYWDGWHLSPTPERGAW